MERQYYIEVYNKLQDYGELKMLGKLRGDAYTNNLKALEDHTKSLFRENKIDKPMLNKILKLIDSYKKI